MRDRTTHLIDLLRYLVVLVLSNVMMETMGERQSHKAAEWKLAVSFKWSGDNLQYITFYDTVKTHRYIFAG